jgi:hypothetical protein
MGVVITIVGAWVALSLSFSAFIIWQRSPYVRHQIFRWTIGRLIPTRERGLSHRLVEAVRHYHR